MRANDLILELRQKGFTIREDGGYLDISPGNIPPELVQQLTKSKPEILAELKREAEQVEHLRERRRLKVIALLEAAPGTQRTVFANTESDLHNVILAVAIRHPTPATCEMLIPKAKYDAWRLLELIERHGQTTH
jgi:hypothetical protein